MRATRPGSERGFSLIELMVAMFITMIVSGAIYALLSSGQNAFRREPEVSDRQQNIRLAMDIITKDVANAGSNVPSFAQVFTPTDPGGVVLNGMGPAGAMGATAQALRNGDPSTNSDVLELIAADDRCPAQAMCTAAPVPGTAGAFGTREYNPACLSNQAFTIQTDNVNMTIQPTLALLPTACPGGNAAQNGGVNLGAAVAVGTNPVAPAFSPPGGGIQAFLYAGRVARYMIAVNPDPLDPVPVLWRSVTGRYDRLGALSPAPGAANSAWQMVARGIDDLQVEYRDGTNVWTNVAPAAVACGSPDACANAAAFTALIREVRVTLSARTAAPQLSGGLPPPAGGAGPNAIRGQLVSVVQPRGSFWALQMGGQIR